MAEIADATGWQKHSIRGFISGNVTKNMGLAVETTTKKQSRQDATPGFAIRLTESTDLGLAMLILVTEDNQQQPIAVVATLNEAHEIAQNDLRHRMCRLERDPAIQAATPGLVRPFYGA